VSGSSIQKMEKTAALGICRMVLTLPSVIASVQKGQQEL
jgi:hypothetical protein